MQFVFLVCATQFELKAANLLQLKERNKFMLWITQLNAIIGNETKAQLIKC